MTISAKRYKTGQIYSSKMSKQEV